ncbi:UNVERIFIED_ORG: RNA polymerase sigma factor (sigma-70 family) [Arthrobacter sp. UYCu721]
MRNPKDRKSFLESLKPFGPVRTLKGMGNKETGEEGLWHQSLLGEGDAFGALYDRHRGRVFRHAYRLCGNHHDAEDIMAASFLELWRRRKNVRVVEGSVLPWLLVTTTNLARNRARATLRYQRLLNSLPRTQELNDPTADTYRRYQDALDQDLARALAILTTEDLHLVSLVVFEEHTIAAAAAVLNLTPAAAKSRMHRARQRLRAVLEGPPSIPTAPTPVLEGERP